MTDATRQRVHYVAGASGTGKSTHARTIMRAWDDELASNGRPTLLIATDVVRAQLRTAIDAATCPELLGESFNLEPRDADDLVVRDVAIGAFLRQSAPILRAVEAGVEYALGEGWNVVVEGVHLVAGRFDHPDPAVVDVTFELIALDDVDEHVARLRTRDADSDGRRSAAHYERNLDRIRVVQQLHRERLALWAPDASAAGVHVVA